MAKHYSGFEAGEWSSEVDITSESAAGEGTVVRDAWPGCLLVVR